MVRVVVIMIVKLELPIAKQIQHDSVILLIVSYYKIIIHLHQFDQNHIYWIINCVVFEKLIDL